VRWFGLILIALCLASCVPVPDAPDGTSVPLTNDGLLVVCEGLWRQDNATLSFVTADGRSERDVVSRRNPGMRLGDTGTDLLVQGDSVFIVMSTSRSIEVFHRVTGLWLGRVRFESGYEPYKLTLLNDSVAYCSLLSGDAVAEIDLRRLRVDVIVPVGPAPEGLCVLGTNIYVAVSGLGDLRKNEEGASTVRVLDVQELRTVGTIEGLPNVMDCVADPQRNAVWIVYRHYASEPDSMGGVVRYDVAAGRITEHLRFSSPKGIVLDPANGTLHILHRNGIDTYDPAMRSVTRIVDHVSANGNDIWYTLGLWAARDLLVVGNARKYVTDGEVIAFTRSGAEILRAPVGLNPSAMR
jgi:hypothetical protein